MDEKPKRPWYQFSLHTFFVVVTITCVGFGYWVYCSKKWISQRHEWLAAHPDCCRTHTPDEPMPLAPAGLWLLGEAGVQIILADSDEWPIAHRLFPEVRVLGYPSSSFENLSTLPGS